MKSIYFDSFWSNSVKDQSLNFGNLLLILSAMLDVHTFFYSVMESIRFISMKYFYDFLYILSKLMKN